MKKLIYFEEGRAKWGDEKWLKGKAQQMWERAKNLLLM